MSEDIPLHELMSRILTVERPLVDRKKSLWSIAGTLQGFNQRLEKYAAADFINYNLRGIGQVIFVNNPISGALILLALFIQSPWVGWMSLLGVVSSTTTAWMLRLDRATIRNGIFGYNGVLVGAALATFSNLDQGAGWLGWAIVVMLFAALTTVLMKIFGIWWAKTFHSPALTLPFNIVTLLCLALVSGIPQPWFVLRTATTDPVLDLDGLHLLSALPIGFGQVFLADRLIAGVLILLAVALCTPLGALVGLMGCSIGILAGLLLGVTPNSLYAGLWSYNGALAAMAVGGVFYAPTGRSISIGLACAFLSAIAGKALGLLFARLGLPVLTVPFCIVTIGCFMLLRRSLPSLVPVALHAVTSPEEHQQRYRVAKAVITNFRHQLSNALLHQRHFYLFEQASPAIKGDLRYLFNRIDSDQSETLLTQELSAHLHQAGQVSSEDELAYLFACMDRDGNGSISFEEFGELMLRHRRLMANYTEFVTYFLPIDADGDDAISWNEMNAAMASVGESRLSQSELTCLSGREGNLLTWNRFIEMLLIT